AEYDVDARWIEGQYAGKNLIRDDSLDVFCCQLHPMRIEPINSRTSKEQSSAWRLTTAIGIASVNLEIWCATQARHEVAQNKLAGRMHGKATIIGPAAIPDQINILCPGQDWTVVVKNPAIGFHVIVWILGSKGVLGQGRL